MLQKLGSYIIYGNRFCGVEITQHKGKEVFYATMLKKDGNQLYIEDTHEAASLEDLANLLPNKIPVFLIVNNQNVLTKRLESDSSEPLKLVNKAFPNINLSDVNYEVLVQDSIHFVSICRKEYIESLIQSFKKTGLFIVNISLGNLIVSSTSQYIGQHTIFTSNALIEVEDDQLFNIEINSGTDNVLYDVNGLNCSNQKLLSLNAALDMAVNRYDPQTNFQAEKQNLFADFKQLKIFNTCLKLGLALVFSILLLNFFVFNYYFNEVQSLEQLSQVNQSSKSQIVELNEKLNKSQKMVEDVFNANRSKTSYYTNAIVNGLPSSILLTELNYQPLMKRIRLEKPVEYERDVMMIVGESSDSDRFSDWLEHLENEPWIQKLEAIDYTDVTASSSAFTLKIEIRHDEQD